MAIGERKRLGPDDLNRPLSNDEKKLNEDLFGTNDSKSKTDKTIDMIGDRIKKAKEDLLESSKVYKNIKSDDGSEMTEQQKEERRNAKKRMIKQRELIAKLRGRLTEQKKRDQESQQKRKQQRNIIRGKRNPYNQTTR